MVFLLFWDSFQNRKSLGQQYCFFQVYSDGDMWKEVEERRCLVELEEEEHSCIIPGGWGTGECGGAAFLWCNPYLML